MNEEGDNIGNLEMTSEVGLQPGNVMFCLLPFSLASSPSPFSQKNVHEKLRNVYV